MEELCSQKPFALMEVKSKEVDKQEYALKVGKFAEETSKD
jgi:hypothetical protein